MQSDVAALAGYWLKSAEGDLRVCADYAEELPPTACFHAQQVAEKALKAVLTLVAGDAPRSHVADTLLRELSRLDAEAPADVAEAARSLDKYYAPTRYPDALGGADPATSYSAREARLALDTATTVIGWARSVVAIDA